MTRIEGEKVLINKPQSEVFSFLSNFNNFQKLMPEQVINWKSTENECSFTIKGIINSNSPVSIEVMNTLGQVIYHDTATTRNGMMEKSITLVDAVHGLYYLKLNTGRDSKMVKLLIE